jgi:hydroxymethylglutaryl-CoA reductase
MSVYPFCCSLCVDPLQEEVKILQKETNLPFETANRMIENVIGSYPLPLAIATNFFINGTLRPVTFVVMEPQRDSQGKDYLIPMALEEASVVAAASNAAKLARPAGGFTGSLFSLSLSLNWFGYISPSSDTACNILTHCAALASEPLMIGQIQIVNVPDLAKAKAAIEAHAKEIVELADKVISLSLSLSLR